MPADRIAGKLRATQRLLVACALVLGTQMLWPLNAVAAKVSVGHNVRSVTAKAALPGALASPVGGDSERVARAYEALDNYQPDRAIVLLVPELNAALAAGAARRKDACRYLLLMAHAFSLDDNAQSNLRCLRSACLLDSENIMARCLYVDALNRTFQSGLAEHELDELKPLVHKNYAVARSLGKFYMARRQLDEAEKYFLIGKNLNEQDAGLHQCLMYLYTGKDAAEEGERAAQCLSSPYQRELVLASVEHALGNLYQERSHVLKAEQLSPDDPSWKLRMGDILLAQKKNEEAFAKYRNAAESRRYSRKCLAKLALFSAWNGQKKCADQCVRRLLTLSGDCADAHWVAGQVYLVEGKSKQADKEFHQSLVISPYMGMTYHVLSMLPSYSNDEAKSAWLQSEWLKYCGYSYEPWLFKADWLRKHQRWQEAFQAYRQCEELLPSHRAGTQARLSLKCRIVSRIGLCLYKTSDLHWAVKRAREFNQLKPVRSDELVPVRPQHIDFSRLVPNSMQEKSADHGVLADLLYECGDLDDCIQEYKTAIATDDKIEWHRGLLKAYMDKQDWGNAAGEDFKVSNHAVTHDIPDALSGLNKASKIPK